MPYVNFKDIPDNEDFSPLPDGKYPVIVELVEQVFKDEVESWILHLKVESGDFSGRMIWDRLFWKPGKTMNRIKIVGKALGFDKGFEGSLMPNEFHGRRATVEVKTETYDGKERNKVTFAGYWLADTVQTETKPTPVQDSDDVPF